MLSIIFLVDTSKIQGNVDNVEKKNLTCDSPNFDELHNEHRSPEIKASDGCH